MGCLTSHDLPLQSRQRYVTHGTGGRGLSSLHQRRYLGRSTALVRKRSSKIGSGPLAEHAASVYEHAVGERPNVGLAAAVFAPGFRGDRGLNQVDKRIKIGILGTAPPVVAKHSAGAERCVAPWTAR